MSPKVLRIGSCGNKKGKYQGVKNETQWRDIFHHQRACGEIVTLFRGGLNPSAVCLSVDV